MKKVAFIIILTSSLYSESFECRNTYDHLKTLVHLQETYKNDTTENEKESMLTKIKSEAKRCIASCDNDKLIYCLNMSKKY